MAKPLVTLWVKVEDKVGSILQMWGSEVDSRIFFVCGRPLCSNWKLNVEVFRWRERLQLNASGSLLDQELTCMVWELWPGSVTHDMQSISILAGLYWYCYGGIARLVTDSCM